MNSLSKNPINLMSYIQDPIPEIISKRDQDLNWIREDLAFNKYLVNVPEGYVPVKKYSQMFSGESKTEAVPRSDISILVKNRYFQQYWRADLLSIHTPEDWTDLIRKGYVFVKTW